MKTLEEHRKILREIADTAFTTGLNSLTEEQQNRHPNLSKEEFSLFIQKCHDGYKLAQKMLIKEIIEYQELLSSLKISLKSARRDRNKSEEEKIDDTIHVISNRIRSFTHIADTMAWLMLGSEIHIARRFHIGEYEIKQVNSLNLKHAIEVADGINRDPDEFALLSDLTSYIQIGDLLVKSKIGNIVMELKEGKVNKDVSEFLQKLKENGEVLDDAKLSEKFDKDTAKQIKRVARQRQRMERMGEVLAKDEGINPADGKKLRVYTPKIATEKYLRELEELHLELNKKNWSYGVVDECLLIGMYKEEMIAKGGPFLIEVLLKEKTKNYLIIDWQTITSSLSEPIFSKPFSPDFIIDVLTGKVKVILGLDCDALIACFKREGLEGKWMTELETKRLKTIDNDVFAVNGRAMEFKTKDGEYNQVGWGIITKILYDSIKPSNLAKQFLSLNAEDFG